MMEELTNRQKVAALNALVVKTLQRFPHLMTSEFMKLEEIGDHDAACEEVYRKIGLPYSRIIPLRGYSVNGYVRTWQCVLRPIMQQIERLEGEK